MASLVTHALVGTAVAQLAPLELRKRGRFWFVAILCSILPDFDVIGFRFGVRYSDLWGHRGMTHSLLFAAIVAAGFAVWMQKTGKERLKLASLLFAITASHGLLDALTDGGLGVAFFSPFVQHRYFFPWRPIRVSPIGAHALFSSRTTQVLWSERWVWGAALAFVFAIAGLRGMLRGYRDRRRVAEIPAQNRVN